MLCEPISNPLLRAQKMTLNVISPKKNERPKEEASNVNSVKNKKESKSIVSFFNFSKPKGHKKTVSMGENMISSSEFKEFKEEKYHFRIMQQDENVSQCGSQFGQENHDHQLRQVISRKYHKHKNENLSPKMPSYRSPREQNQSTLTTKPRTVKKFRTEINSKTCSPPKQPLSSMRQLSSSTVGSPLNQQSLKLFFGSEVQEPIISNRSLIEVRQEARQNVSAFTRFENMAAENPSKQNVMLSIKPFRVSNKRSKTQEEVQDNQIFEKYENLKDAFKSASKIYMNKLAKYKDKINTLPIAQLTQANSGQFDCEQHSKSNLKPQQCFAIQSIFKVDSQNPKSCLTPKGFKKVSQKQKQSINKLIKTRQRNFFQKVCRNELQSSALTFQQIKSRLSKMQQIDSKKRLTTLTSNKSSTLVGKNSPTVTDLLMYVTNEKIEQEKDKQLVVKYNGIPFKANLVRKHTDFYQKFNGKKKNLEESKVQKLVWKKT